MLPRNDALWTGVQNEVTLSSVQTTRTVRLRSRLTFRSGRHFTQVTKDETTPQYPYSSPTRDRPRVHMRHYHSQNRTSVLRHPSHKHRAKKCHWRGQWRSLGHPTRPTRSTHSLAVPASARDPLGSPHTRSPRTATRPHATGARGGHFEEKNPTLPLLAPRLRPSPLRSRSGEREGE